MVKLYIAIKVKNGINNKEKLKTRKVEKTQVDVFGTNQNLKKLKDWV